MKNVPKKAAAVAGMTVLVGTVLFTFAQSRKDRSVKKALKKIVPIESQVSVQNGRTVISVSPKEQKLAGIATSPAQRRSARRQITAPARVVSVASLAKFRERYVAAQAQLAKAQAHAEVSRKQYARMKALYQNNQNVSQKAVESAQGAWRSDQDSVREAQQELRLQGLAAGQKWGRVVEQWVEKGTPILNRVLDQETLLVQVTIPAGETLVHPAKTRLSLPGGKHREAAFVSLFPRVDPRIQGAGLLYQTSAHAGLAPGARLFARFAVGKKRSGVKVPRSAVVWTQGKQWVYEETAPGRFSRRLLEDAQQEGNGFFVPQGLSPGDTIVVRGAQVLLSEEFHSEIQPED